MVRAPSAFVLATFIAVLVAAAATPSTAEDSVLIKPSYKVGDVWYVEYHEDSKQKLSGQQAPGGGAAFEYSYTIGLRQEVKAIENGETLLELTIDRIGIDIPVPMMGRFTYDTDIKKQQGTSGLSLMLDPLIGMKVTMRVDDKLAITAFDGTEAIIQKLQLAGRHPLLNQIAGLFMKGRQSWGEEPLALYADKEVKVGETWTKQLDIEAPGQGTLHDAFTFNLAGLPDKPGDANAVVEFDVEMTLDVQTPKDGPWADKEMKMEDAAAHGSYRFDTGTGQIVDMSRQGKLTIRITQKPASEGAEPVLLLCVKQDSQQSMRSLSPAEREKEKTLAATTQPAEATSQPAATSSQPTAPTSQPAAPASQPVAPTPQP